MTKVGKITFSSTVFVALLVTLLSILRIVGVISTSFFWIFAPIWIPVSIIMLVCAAIGALLVMPFLWDPLWKSSSKRLKRSS